MQGVIFDFNGTLFFDTPKHELAWRQYALKLCGRYISDEEFRDCVHGRTNAEILKYFLGDSITSAEILLHSEGKEAVYRELCLKDRENFHLADGAEDFLDELKRRGTPMAIATSSNKTNSDFYIRKFRMERWFDLNTFVYNDGSFRSKPQPDIYLKAAEAIGLEPQECVIFEDMPSGIESAKAAGAGSIIAVASALDREFLEGINGVDAVICNYVGVLNILNI